MPIMDDLRIKKTTSAIEQAMMELIEIKGFSKIKIIDIANKAQVNRNTIYLHYQSKEDIVLGIIENHHGELNVESKIFECLKHKTQKNYLYNLFNDLINGIEQNIELYRILLTDHNLNGVLSYRINKYRENLIKGLKNDSKNQIHIDYLIAGIFGVISKWIIYATSKKENIVNELTEIAYEEMNKLQ